MIRQVFWIKITVIIGIIAVLGGLILAGNAASTRPADYREICLLGIVQNATQPDSGGPVFFQIVAAPQEIDRKQQRVVHPMVIVCSYFNFPDTLYIWDPEKEDHEM